MEGFGTYLVEITVSHSVYGLLLPRRQCWLEGDVICFQTSDGYRHNDGESLEHLACIAFNPLLMAISATLSAPTPHTQCSPIGHRSIRRLPLERSRIPSMRKVGTKRWRTDSKVIVRSMMWPQAWGRRCEPDMAVTWTPSESSWTSLTGQFSRTSKLAASGPSRLLYPEGTMQWEPPKPPYSSSCRKF